MNETTRTLKLKKKKNVESENNKENYPSQRGEEIEKNEEIITLESQSEDNKKAEGVGKAEIASNRQLRKKQRRKT